MDEKDKCDICREEIDLEYEKKYLPYFEDGCNCNTIKLIKEFELKLKVLDEKWSKIANQTIKIRKEITKQEILNELDEGLDFLWALEQIEKALSKHHTPAENIMNLVSHLISKLRKIKQGDFRG